MSSWVERVAKLGSSVVFGWEVREDPLTSKTTVGPFSWMFSLSKTRTWKYPVATDKHQLCIGRLPGTQMGQWRRSGASWCADSDGKEKITGGGRWTEVTRFYWFPLPPRSRCFSNRASPRRQDSQLTDQMAQYSTVGMFLRMLRKRVCALQRNDLILSNRGNTDRFQLLFSI